MPTSRKAKVVRRAEEFGPGVFRQLTAPMASTTASYSWSLALIHAARDAQLAGQFAQSARLAVQMRTDDAAFAAYQNRLAPMTGLRVCIEPASDTAAAAKQAEEAESLYGDRGPGVAPGALVGILGDLCNHGVAVGYNVKTVRDDGTRVDLVHHHWPIEFVSWNSVERRLEARVEGGGLPVPIEHGNGTWTVYAKHENAPWTQEACILPAAALWADRAFARRDRSAASKSIGNVKVVGELPEGIPLQVKNDDGTTSVSPEAQAMMDLCTQMADVYQTAGIRPAGSKIDLLTNNATSAWTVFPEIIKGADVSFAKIYLGTDALSGTQSAGPGTDATRLWGIMQNIVESDLGCIERGFFEGVLQVWSAINFGDSANAPWRIWEMPDPDEAAERSAFAERMKAFLETIKALQGAGIELNQKLMDLLADRYDVPTLPVPPKPEPAAPGEEPGGPEAEPTAEPEAA